MSDLDKAIDAAREAMERKLHSLSDVEYILSMRSRALRDLLAALDAVQAPPAGAVQNREPRTGLASQCYDSAQLSTLPKWCRDLLAKAADALSEAPPAAADADEDAYVIERMGKLLAEIAIIVNGTEPHDTLWSYHDLPEKVRALKQAPPAAAVPVWQEHLADSLECFWNAAIGAERNGSSPAGAMAEGIHAIASRLREHAMLAAAQGVKP